MSNLNRKSRIETLWWQGVPVGTIAKQIECSRDYVSYIVNQMNIRPASPYEMGGDDELHLALIRQANRGMGFPVCVKPNPIVQVRKAV